MQGEVDVAKSLALRGLKHHASHVQYVRYAMLLKRTLVNSGTEIASLLVFIKLSIVSLFNHLKLY